MTAPATDAEATVICSMLAPWRLHQLVTRPGDARRAEREGRHGWACGGWKADACGRGISYEYTPGYRQPPTMTGLITWARITDIVRAAAPAFLGVQAMWARRAHPPGPSPIADHEAHEREAHRLHWLMRDLGEQIKDRIRNPYPLGQLDLFDLIGAGA